MFEGIILGIVQGIAEWLPVSSEGLITLIKINFFHQSGLANIVRFALFLHLGTFLAVLIYFRQELLRLVRAILNYRLSLQADRLVLVFLIISTLISGALGFALLQVLIHFEEKTLLSGKIITLLIGLLLLITAGLQLGRKKQVYKTASSLKITDGILLGLVQGLAVLPGLSRSGLTISALLLRKFNDSDALRLSFLMSLPIVLGGNIILNLGQLDWSLSLLMGFGFSFIFGLLTIHFLLKLAQRINWGYFVLLFGLLMIVSLAL